MTIPGLYTDFFGLKERPFALLPDPDFIYWSGAYRRAFTVLEYGIISRAPITVITGEVGAGKTTLVQALLKAVEQDTTVGLISNAQGGRGELLRWALNAYDVECDPTLDYVGLFQTMQDFLLREYSQGRRVVLIIDEAQNLSVDALEEIRMLTNINANKDELLQLILVGQPELREMITRPSMRQFAQRVVASFHIPPMTRAEVEAYISHRLIHAGGTGEEFSRHAMGLVWVHSEGIPRMVNKLCDFAMVYAAATEQRHVDAETIEDVLRDNIFLETRATEDPENLFTLSSGPTDKAAE
ncbi:ExeA family protein [Actibacterium ureilyticum]|uniref:ExeA family protein n=1 Tax=Actibacterium ureilyticum TaxID=1590614 RepID=UPI000BAB06CA|nr:AAA family ATPase [Actibacterium ureilyticum]